MDAWRPALIVSAVVIVALVAASTAPKAPAGPAWEGAAPITAWRYASMIRVGLAVNWLNYPRVEHWYFYWRNRGVSIAGLVRAEGFDHVRIRVSGDVVSNKTLLRLLGVVVYDCLRAGLAPIITYTANDLREHPTSPEAQRHFVEWWVTVAEYLRGAPYLVSYDLIIETSGAIRDEAPILNKVYNETIEAIRRVDPYRIIIVTPPEASSPFALDELRVHFDDYMMVEWHIYAGGPKGPSGEPYNETLIEEAIAHAEEWSRAHGVPVWMGAWRPNRYPKHGIQHYPDGAPRGVYSLRVAVEFSRYMAATLCNHGIPFTVNADTLFLDYQHARWYPSQEAVLDAILGPCRHVASTEAPSTQ
ncbi:MAG: glycoside hydrolase family 5 protein [Desulfurococcales archaeon]|nr:glycoside hydrolase family 5 protein [Desulfurococcales archaeon]